MKLGGSNELSLFRSNQSAHIQYLTIHDSVIPTLYHVVWFVEISSMLDIQ